MVIFRLNAAGRHYLIEDAASKKKGVEVLIRAKENLDHMLENPSLCDLTRSSPASPRGTKKR